MLRLIARLTRGAQEHDADQHHHAELRITDPEQITTYLQITDTLWAVAAEGDAARAVLVRVLGQI